MPLAFDHLILVARDLEAGARDLQRSTGLASLDGGAHDGQGTANRIVPLGPSYLELLAVVDPTVDSPMASMVAARDEGPAALCLATDDLDAVAGRLGTRPLPMSRTRPDGVTLRWRLAGLAEAFTEGTPFFIEWDLEPGTHPGAGVAAHDVTPRGIAWVELGGDAAAIAAVLGDHDLDIRLVGGAPGVRRVGIATGGQDVIVVGAAGD